MAFTRRKGPTDGEIVTYQSTVPVREDDLKFDYDSLDDDQVAAELRTNAISIKGAMGQVRDAMGVIGERLIAAREMLLGNGYPAGTYGKWVKAEFNMSARQAQHVANVARRIASDDRYGFLLEELGRTSLYELAAPSTPPQALEEVAQRTATGTGSGKGGKVTLQDVRDAVSRAKQALTLDEAIALLRQAAEDLAGSTSPREMHRALRRQQALRRRIMAGRQETFELKQDVFESAIQYLAQELDESILSPRENQPKAPPQFVTPTRPLTPSEAVVELSRWIERYQADPDRLSAARKMTLPQARAVLYEWMDLTPEVFRQAQGTMVARYALQAEGKADRLQVVRRELSALLLGIAPEHDWVQLLAQEVADSDQALAEIRLILAELLGAVKAADTNAVDGNAR